MSDLPVVASRAAHKYGKRFQKCTSHGQNFERKGIREALLALQETGPFSHNWCMSGIFRITWADSHTSHQAH